MSFKNYLTNCKYYSLPENPHRNIKSKVSGACKKREDITKLVKYIDDNLIGRNTTFNGPYGRRKVVYCDYCASGRSLQFIEDYILKEVLPNCGHAYSTTSITSLQSTLFRHEAKEIFRLCTNATDDDLVIFADQGSRGPINKLLEELKLRFRKPPVVFIGPCEHHSAIKPWKRLGAKVVRISESKEGFLDLNDLENQLLVHRNCGSCLIGCFSASNNITGILADDVATTLVLHQHGALAFWDYSTAAPYVQLDMNPTLPGVEESSVHKDVMFFAGHKFLGGIQTPGILIVKKSLLEPTASTTVRYSLAENHECALRNFDVDFEDDRGTASVVEDIRAGMVMHLKEAVGVPAIMSREEKITRNLLSHVKNIPEFVLLGNNSHNLKRLPFFSFVVRHPRGMFLHHNFVCSVLNDVFGIQARGIGIGSTSYSQYFMGIDIKLAEDYEETLQREANEKKDQPGLEILRPGFTKISLPFCISDAELGFILEALKMVATEGWKLLPQYTLKPCTGEWRHHSNSIFRDKKWLGSLKYIEGKLVVPERKISTQGTCPADYEECLHVARCIFNKARKIAQRYPQAAQRFSFDEKIEPLRWFMLPSEAHDLLIGNSQNVRHKIPFDPNKYGGCRGDPLEVQKNLNLKKLSAIDNETLAVNSTTTGAIMHPLKECRREGSLFSAGLDENTRNSQYAIVPNTNSFSLSDGKQSFSSETSNSDVLESIICHQNNFHSNTSPVMSNSHSPTLNSSDSHPYFSLTSASSHLPSKTDMNSHNCKIHNNSLLLQSYSLSHNNGKALENALYMDRVSSGMKQVSNFVVSDKTQSSGKTDLQHPVNKVHFLLGKNEISPRQRCNSLGSSLILHPRNRGNSGYSCRSLTDGETSLNLSECSLSSNEDIHAYVTEVTKELATEIKSEIREVISKVEDVLSESADTEGANHASEHRCSKTFEPKFEKLERTNSLPSASASDIAQYLMGVSKEMAEEMKSEIRGLVSSVVSTESFPVFDKREKRVTIDPQSREEKDKQKKSEVAVLNNENISQSRDSGINLSYSEAFGDSKIKEKDILFNKCQSSKSNDCSISKRNRNESLDFFQHEHERISRCRSESLDSLQENEDSDAVVNNQTPRRKISRASKKTEKCFCKNRLSGESSNDEGMNTEENAKPKWYCPSKAIWKPTLEALKEFEMIQNGDKILICLSGGKNSLAILHTLHQYRFYASSRGIHFELGAATFNPYSSNLNAKALTLYLEGLGIPYFFEEQRLESQTDSLEVNSRCNVCWKIKRGHLYSIAGKRNYNVVALSQNLDDFAESFLLSAFHNGRLRSMKAHYFISDKQIRVIRPFVYVREKAIRQFVENENLPSVPENCPSCKNVSKERHGSKQLLSHQESMFPRLFNSLKAALHPLISYKYTNEEERPAKYVTDSDETSLT